ncbi:MAG TPA: hypothetical protein VFR11_21540 [Micromonosporaceae bacterium]|nr:hypothetical protein [Micromonosporaceae bacterium]
MIAIGAATRPRLALPTARLARLHAAGRGIPRGLAMLVLCAVGLRIVLAWATPGSDGARPLPLLFEALAASVVGIVFRSPFGEVERVTGRWLPVLRFAAVPALTAAAFGALAAGSAGARLDLGYAGLARDLIGLVGLSLATATVIGALLCWLGPVAFWLVSLYAIGSHWTTPWVWTAHLPSDTGAWLCAVAVLVVGTILVATFGARDGLHE